MYVVKVKFDGSRAFNFKYDLNKNPEVGDAVLVWNKPRHLPEAVIIRAVTPIEEFDGNVTDKVLMNITDLVTSERERRSATEALQRMITNAVIDAGYNGYDNLVTLAEKTQEILGLQK